MSDPRRLREDPALGATLRDDLARAPDFTSYDVDTGLTRFRATLGIPERILEPGLSTSEAGVGKVLLGWKAVFVGLAFAGASGVVAVTVPAGKSARQAAPTIPPRREVISNAEVPKASPPVTVPEPPAPAVARAEQVPVDVPLTLRRSIASRDGQEDQSWAIRREIAQLARARRLLKTDPLAALALADRGQREFSGGMFGQEREAIAILALISLQRRDAALQRGATFLRQYAGGPFSERIQKALPDLARHARKSLAPP